MVNFCWFKSLDSEEPLKNSSWSLTQGHSIDPRANVEPIGRMLIWSYTSQDSSEHVLVCCVSTLVCQLVVRWICALDSTTTSFSCGPSSHSFWDVRRNKLRYLVHSRTRSKSCNSTGLEASLASVLFCLRVSPSWISMGRANVSWPFRWSDALTHPDTPLLWAICAGEMIKVQMMWWFHILSNSSCFKIQGLNCVSLPKFHARADVFW